MKLLSKTMTTYRVTEGKICSSAYFWAGVGGSNYLPFRNNRDRSTGARLVLKPIPDFYYCCSSQTSKNLIRGRFRNLKLRHFLCEPSIFNSLTVCTRFFATIALTKQSETHSATFATFKITHFRAFVARAKQSYTHMFRDSFNKI